MDEQTPSMIPAQEPPQSPRDDNSSIVGQRALFLVLGVAIGGAAVLGTLYLSKMDQTPPKPAGAPIAQNVTPPIGSSVPGVMPPSEPNLGNMGAAESVKPGPATTPDMTKPGATTGTNSTAGVTTPGTGKPVPGATEPFNPFDGAVSATMPPAMKGHITPGEGVKLPTTGPGTPTPPQEHPSTAIEVDPASKGLLYTIRMDVQDPRSAIRSLQSAAVKQGGSAIQFDENAVRSDPEGAIVFVPASKAPTMEKLLGAVGSIVASDKWSGTSTDRIDKIEHSADERLSDLHMQRQEMLVKYFEDAPQVRHIDEDSERINRCLSALRAQKPGASTAVFKIKFLG